MTRAEFDTARKALALTIREFCALTDMHPTTVSRWGVKSPPDVPGWVPRLLAAWGKAGVPRPDEGHER